MTMLYRNLCCKEGSYNEVDLYLGSRECTIFVAKNKLTDQLRGLFSHQQKADFLITWLILLQAI